MALKSVAILGCGPAGLMAAHAARLSGWDFKIFSRKVKSQLYGAQYLHKPIPHTPCYEPQTVRYQLMGTSEQYRLKVYGDIWDGTTSPEDYMVAHDAWDLRMLYDFMWEKFSDEIVEMDFNNRWPAIIRGIQSLPDSGGPDLVISTVPRKIWAEPGDEFLSAKVWALGDTEMPRVEKPYRPEPFTVMCDATPKTPWYRISNIFGYCTIEWPYNTGIKCEPDYVEYNDGYRYYTKGFRSPHPGASLVEKPLSHNSTAASDFVHLGRYGAWQKGILTSDVFYDAMKVLVEDKI